MALQGRDRGALTRVALGALVLAAACAPNDAQFSVRSAADFVADKRTVSVFGVYRDGKMSPKYWELLATPFAGALGSPTCEIGFGEHLSTDDPELYSKIDHDTRDDGLSPEIVGLAAARAKGDVILAVTVFGHPPIPHGNGKADPNAPVAGGLGGGGGLNGGGGGMGGGGMGGRGGMGGGGGGRGRSSSRYQSTEPADESAFEMSAELISVATKESVARVDMHYTGASVDEAIAKFAERLRTEVPSAKCVGWTWKN